MCGWLGGAANALATGRHPHRDDRTRQCGLAGAEWGFPGSERSAIIKGPTFETVGVTARTGPILFLCLTLLIQAAQNYLKTGQTARPYRNKPTQSGKR
jgi:hypothetical protein